MSACPPCYFIDPEQSKAEFKISGDPICDADGTEWYKFEDIEANILVTSDGQRWRIGNAEKYREFNRGEIYQIFGCTIDDFRPTVSDDHVRHGNISAPLTRDFAESQGEIAQIIQANANLKAKIADLTEQIDELKIANMKLTIRLQSK